MVTTKKIQVTVTGIEPLKKKYGTFQTRLLNSLNKTVNKVVVDASVLMKEKIRYSTHGTRRLENSIFNQSSVTQNTKGFNIDVKTIVSDVGGEDKISPEIYWKYVDKGYIPHWVYAKDMTGWLKANSLYPYRNKYFFSNAVWSENGIRFLEKGTDFINKNLMKSINADVNKALKGNV